MSDQLEILKDFPVKIEIPVAWGEMDAYGHVNNVVYFRYFESAQVRYFDLLGFNEVLKSRRLGALIHQISCTYMIPIVYPDTLQAGVMVSEIKKDSLSMEFFILSLKNGLSAFGESEMVIYDFSTSKKIDIPLPLKKAIEKLENKTL